MSTPRPAFGTLMGRALRLRCAWCGDRPGFRRGWFGRHERCSQCGMSVQRGQQGFELGAASVNAVLTFGVLVVAGAASIIASYPDVAVGPLLLWLGLTAIVLPIVLYPFTYTIWFAFELLVEPPSAAEIEQASTHSKTLPIGP